MLLELAKPIALLFSLLSLLAVFHAFFLIPGTLDVLNPGPALHDRIIDSLFLLALSAGICIVSGLLFREASTSAHPRLTSTLPLQLFYWTVAVILILFPLSWFLETHYIFTPSIHW